MNLPFSVDQFVDHWHIKKATGYAYSKNGMSHFKFTLGFKFCYVQGLRNSSPLPEAELAFPVP